jgi:anti-sigma factor RsiW
MQTTEQTTPGNPGDLNHPTREQWIAHLYGEDSAPDNARLAEHLNQCTECQARVRQWRATMTALNQWELPVSRPAPAYRLLPKWGIAAALVLGIGIGIGSSQLFSPNTRQLRAEFQAKLSRQHDDMMAEVTRVIDERRAQDARLTLAALRDLNGANRADYDALHKELETMAVLTEDSLRQAQQQIVTLASFTKPN